MKASAPTALVVATAYDPATPYRGALKLVRELGNAWLLTMRGALRPAGTVCRQHVPFAQPQAAATATGAMSKAARKALQRLHGVLAQTG